jgi:hypothetical protein
METGWQLPSRFHFTNKDLLLPQEDNTTKKLGSNESQLFDRFHFFRVFLDSASARFAFFGPGFFVEPAFASGSAFTGEVCSRRTKPTGGGIS